MERIQGVIAHAVYMDPVFNHNVERTRALGEAVLNSIFSLFHPEIWEFSLKSV